MECLVFGNQSHPSIGFRLDPQRGFLLTSQKNHVLHYTGLDEISWEDLLTRCSPGLVPGASYYFRPGGNRSPEGDRRMWDRLKEKLISMTSTDGEKAFFVQYLDLCEDYDPNQGMNDLLQKTALIPQVWLNWIPYDKSDQERAARAKKEPFRVDFAMFYRGRRIVVEIDGSSHFTEDHLFASGVRREPSMERFTEHLKKDRWLRRAGWEVWRFTNLELDDPELGIIGLLCEMNCHDAFV